MNTKILYLFTRTPLHVGAGSSVGAIDQPVQRERHTGFPIIPGSSLKGVLADLWNDDDYKRTAEGKILFGEDEGGQKDENDKEIKAKAGTLLIGEAKLLAFPVRSAKGMFAWITSPLALQRYARNTGINLEPFPEKLSENKCWATEGIKRSDAIVLEEYKFDSIADPTPIAKQLKAIFNDSVWESIDTRFAIISDEMFSYFATYACEVTTHIKVNDETGTVKDGALFNKEQVPSETLFYSMINSSKGSGPLSKLADKLKQNNGILQIGADATTGLGFCSSYLNDNNGGQH